ncbi:hypothetical protein F5Y05DRAFT_19743 [Hypoxylon sp. FL0543]|nr:hypothetical protein F5Y05DRAFT_19743 [Hypoxylon sp. FL0543]
MVEWKLRWIATALCLLGAAQLQRENPRQQPLPASARDIADFHQIWIAWKYIIATQPPLTSRRVESNSQHRRLRRLLGGNKRTTKTTRFLHVCLTNLTSSPAFEASC